LGAINVGESSHYRAHSIVLLFKHGGRSRCRAQSLSEPTVFKTVLQAVAIHLPYDYSRVPEPPKGR